MKLTNRQVAALVVTVPLSAFFLYLLFKKHDEDDDDFPENSNKTASGQQTVVEIKVPNRCASFIIGRDGSNIKKLQADTGAKINFQDRDPSSEETKGVSRIVKIRGKVDNVLLAERLVRKCIESAPIINTIEITLPQKYIGRIIGRNGTNIRSLCEMSQAKIKIDRHGDDKRLQNRVCKITGTDEQIAFAKSLIDEEIRKDDESTRRKEIASQDRKPRGSKQNSPAEEINYKLDQPVKQPKSMVSQEPATRLIPDHSDYFAVFISAVEHPGHFWMQILGSPSKALDLDILMQSMTEYFTRPVDQESDRLSFIRTGDIVAAPFKHDDNWYRAKVVGFLEDGLVDVYYVDYGDNGSIPKDELKELRSDFLSLPHQATECCLAGVEPLDEFWSEAAIDKFEELTYCAQWKPLMAKVIAYKSTENATLPCLELVDTNKDVDVLIASKLIDSGFARNETKKVTNEHTLFPSVNDAAKMIQESQ